MKRRRSPQSQGSGKRFAAANPHRHRNCAAFGVALLSVIGLVLFIHASFATTGDALASAAWLTPSANGLELETAMDTQSGQNTPSPYSLALHQVLFISCNRHDRGQAYWANIAVAAQCEVLSRKNRAAAAPCRRLYGGQSPLSLDGRMLPEEVAGVPERAPLTLTEEVPLGACGTVYGSTATAAHRASLPLSTAHPTDGKATPLQRYSPRRFPLSPLRVDLPPLDALVWLGDAIYADKRADGKEGQSLLYQHVNTLTEVGRFWRVQRDAAEYTALISSCVATTTTTPLASAAVEGQLLQEQQRRLELPEDDTRKSDAMRDKGKHVEVLGEAVVEKELLIPEPPTTAAHAQTNVWGTWDDHDMGKNDGGKEYAHKQVTQRFFLDFLKAPATDPRWSRAGVYNSQTLPFHAVVDNAKGPGLAVEALLRQLYEYAMCFILLDVRSFRDAPNASHEGDMLGAEQWNWFEGQLQRFTTPTPEGRAPCAVTLIGTGIQFMLDEKPAENWAAFPRSRDRLLGLLRYYGAERVVFLTGDVHMGELGADFTAKAVREVLGYPLLEATSSGLTHSANRYFLPTFFPTIFPSVRRLALYMEKNFGTMRLSLDIPHLPRLRPYLKDTDVDGDGKDGDAHSPAPRLWTAEQRHSAREVVQRALNLTLTIFSLPRHGQPVFRVNAPLSMLTYRDGPRYLDATVDSFHGDVQLRTAPQTATDTPAPGASMATTTTFALRNGTRVVVPHYPNTTPTPFVTWGVRFAQRLIFTGSSVPETLKSCIFLNSCVALVVSAWVLWVLRRLRRKRGCTAACQPWQQQQHQQRGGSFGTPLLERTAELLEESHGRQRWWNRLFRGSLKNKRR